MRTIEFDAQTEQALNRLAAIAGKEPDQIIRDLVADYFEEQEDIAEAQETLARIHTGEVSTLPWEIEGQTLEGGTMCEFISYAETRQFLADKLKATEESIAYEIAAWVGLRSIAAYQNVKIVGDDGHLVGDRDRFYFDDNGRESKNFEYLSKFEKCHFKRAEVEAFEPSERYHSAYVFSTPKPARLIERILRIATKPDDLVLDFFAGSGTTAHAVMKLNAEDGGNRRFILVSSTEAVEEQIPPNPPFPKGGTTNEPSFSKGGTTNKPPFPNGGTTNESSFSNGETLDGLENAPASLLSSLKRVGATTTDAFLPPLKKGGRGGFIDKNLCRDVCAERVRRVMRGYTNKKGEAVEGLGGDFAYLRTRRIPAEAVLSRIEHEQVWTALQLIHTETLQPYATGAAMQTAELPDGMLAYCLKVNEQTLKQLLDLAKGNGIVVVYSWQPGWLRQYLPNENISVEQIPAFLINRFGGDYAA